MYHQKEFERSDGSIVAIKAELWVGGFGGTPCYGIYVWERPKGKRLYRQSLEPMKLITQAEANEVLAELHVLADPKNWPLKINNQ